MLKLEPRPQPSAAMSLASPLLALAMPFAVQAHGGHAEGFTGGFLHPLTGSDHLLAMIMIGWLSSPLAV